VAWAASPEQAQRVEWLISATKESVIVYCPQAVPFTVYPIANGVHRALAVNPAADMTYLATHEWDERTCKYVPLRRSSP
jgi:hypothetical protein